MTFASKVQSHTVCSHMFAGSGITTQISNKCTAWFTLVNHINHTHTNYAQLTTHVMSCHMIVFSVTMQALSTSFVHVQTIVDRTMT